MLDCEYKDKIGLLHASLFTNVTGENRVSTTWLDKLRAIKGLFNEWAKAEWPACVEKKYKQPKRAEDALKDPCPSTFCEYLGLETAREMQVHTHTHTHKHKHTHTHTATTTTP